MYYVATAKHPVPFACLNPLQYLSEESTRRMNTTESLARYRFDEINEYLEDFHTVMCEVQRENHVFNIFEADSLGKWLYYSKASYMAGIIDGKEWTRLYRNVMKAILNGDQGYVCELARTTMHLNTLFDLSVECFCCD